MKVRPLRSCPRRSQMRSKLSPLMLRELTLYCYQYLPVQDLEDVTNALNFDTADSHIIGGCDLYTTKTAGADKKLYKAIEDGLEAQHQTQVAISKTLPGNPAESPNQRIDLSRSSPFGPLSQHTARRTFAYLIATLNASLPASCPATPTLMIIANTLALILTRPHYSYINRLSNVLVHVSNGAFAATSRLRTGAATGAQGW